MRANCLDQSGIATRNHNAAASQSFNRDISERLRFDRRNNQKAMRGHKLAQLVASSTSNKIHRQSLCEITEFWQSRPFSDHGQLSR
jgi:hypothetical protein